MSGYVVLNALVEIDVPYDPFWFLVFDSPLTAGIATALLIVFLLFVSAIAGARRLEFNHRKTRTSVDDLHQTLSD
ncbi:hypothetical protein BRC81_12610 [Halobacteriales archaeon QS_1_68_20]|nr:MAG: hypothetical protein BRC81_12610 [Halobacteriales archaeon QS_1_68_20]